MRFVLAFLMFVSVAHAADRTGQFGLGGSLGYHNPIFDNDFHDAVQGSEMDWGFHGRYHFNSAWGIEVGHQRYEFDDADYRLESTGVTGLYRFNTVNRFSWIAGLGLSHIDAYNGEDWRMGYNALAGAEYDLMECLVLSGTAEYLRVSDFPFGGSHSDEGESNTVLGARVALTWYFGAQKEKAQPAPVKREEPVAEAAAPVDGDDDQDGVLNSKDKCPNSKPGSTVNAYGCVKEEKAEIKVNVEFESGKAIVGPAYRAQLKELADFLNEHKGTTAVIEGHTDNTGSAALNKKLSLARAEAVKTYLTQEFAIESRRLSAEGFGPSKPIADNKTLEGRAHNRRVMAVVAE